MLAGWCAARTGLMGESMATSAGPPSASVMETSEPGVISGTCKPA